MSTPDPQNKACSTRLLWLALISFILLLASIQLHAQPNPKRVLVLYWDNKDFPGNIKFDETFKAQLDLVAERTRRSSAII